MLHFEEFLPQIANWNRSMRQISGGSAYVKVVHADDRIFPECLERMVAFAERHQNVGLVSAYALWQDEVRGKLLPPEVEVVSGREIRRLTLLRKGEVFGSPTTTMIRADLVRARPDFYKPTFIHADTEICFDLLRECHLGFVHQVLPFTRLHPGSVTTFADRVGSWLPERIELLLEHGPEALGEEEYDGATPRAGAVRSPAREARASPPAAGSPRARLPRGVTRPDGARAPSLAAQEQAHRGGGTHRRYACQASGSEPGRREAPPADRRQAVVEHQRSVVRARLEEVDKPSQSERIITAETVGETVLCGSLRRE